MRIGRKKCNGSVKLYFGFISNYEAKMQIYASGQILQDFINHLDLSFFFFTHSEFKFTLLACSNVGAVYLELMQNLTWSKH